MKKKYVNAVLKKYPRYHNASSFFYVPPIPGHILTGLSVYLPPSGNGWIYLAAYPMFEGGDGPHPTYGRIIKEFSNLVPDQLADLVNRLYIDNEKSIKEISSLKGFKQFLLNNGIDERKIWEHRALILILMLEDDLGEAEKELKTLAANIEDDEKSQELLNLEELERAIKDGGSVSEKLLSGWEDSFRSKFGIEARVS